MKSWIVVLAVALSGMTATPSSTAYPTVRKHKPLSKMTLREVERYQAKVISLDRWIIKTRKAHDADVVSFSRHRLRWTRRELRETKAKLRVSPSGMGIAHRALWLCLHPHESTDWHNQDTGGNGHYGGLQMSWGWLGYFSGNPASLSPERQMYYAEKGYRDSGYSRAWLYGQWGQTLGFCTHLI